MSFFSHSVAPASAPPFDAYLPVDAFHSHLSEVYALSAQHGQVFGSPAGPFYFQTRVAYLPRFAFFGPDASDASWRLAFLAGFDHRDLRASHALLDLVEKLARDSEEGHGLNLAFFPLVDAAGLFLGAPSRALQETHWGWSHAPEINLLEQDARLHGYHGFIRIETAPAAGDDIVTVRIREPLGVPPSPDVELISSEETEPFLVRFERESPGVKVADGPLTIADDLPVQPFELTLRIPDTWSDDYYRAAVSAILTRFIVRYRAFQAYGQHL
ncbi:MAG TPA: hypothetical protein VHO24_10425 [Opitutaceae bacterium]|nr:hypothetical protein [Opitutaceae bacterium]